MRRRTLTPDDPRHGVNGYINYACRCPTCTEAHRLRYKMDTAARARRGLTPDDPRHGLPSTYRNWLCRCPACTAANTKLSAEYRLTHPSVRTR